MSGDLIATGQRIRALREMFGVGQRELARQIECSPAALARWEAGDRLADPYIMARLIRIFGVTLDWLFTGELGGVPLKTARALAKSYPDLCRPVPRSGS